MEFDESANVRYRSLVECSPARKCVITEVQIHTDASGLLIMPVLFGTDIWFHLQLFHF